MLLADTSAWHRSAHPSVIEEWVRLLDADEIATTPPVRLEVLFSARSKVDYAAVSDELDALHQIPCDAAVWTRAMLVQRSLSEQHALHHRSVKIPDLLIAAAAEMAGVTLWHYDEDYERVAAITGQPTRWIAPRGSL